MPKYDERTIALAYDDAEAMLSIGTLDQNVIGTLASRGLDWETAKTIVEDLRGAQSGRPKRRYKRRNPAARHLAIDLMLRGIVLIAASIVINVVGNQLLKDGPIESYFVIFVSLAPAMWGVLQFANGLVSFIFGEMPPKSRPISRRLRRW